MTTAPGASASPDGTRLATTESICPRCRRVLAAELVVREGKVVLSRSCPDHGAFEAVVYGDAERYAEIQRFDKPGDEPLERQTPAARGCPHDCGICPEHAQHTCLGIIEVNTVQPRLPDLLRRLGHRPPGARLLADPGAGRGDARRLRPRRGRARIGAVLGR